MSKTINDSANHTEETESFYSRWSKRKLQERSLKQAENQSELSTDINSSLERSVEQRLPSEPNQEKNLLSDKDMPDINSLDEDSDYSGFLSPGVSEELRKVALRKLFQGRAFNICDGLDDYDEEFTSFEKLGDIVTADMRYQLEEEAKRKLQITSEHEEISAKTDDVVTLDENHSEEVISKTLPDTTVDDAVEINESELHDNENLS